MRESGAQPLGPQPKKLRLLHAAEWNRCPEGNLAPRVKPDGMKAAAAAGLAPRKPLHNQRLSSEELAPSRWEGEGKGGGAVQQRGARGLYARVASKESGFV